MLARTQSILTDYVKGNLPRAVLVGTISMACFHESAPPCCWLRCES